MALIFLGDPFLIDKTFLGGESLNLGTWPTAGLLFNDGPLFKFTGILKGAASGDLLFLCA